jgi:hypothetical protein
MNFVFTMIDQIRIRPCSNPLISRDNPDIQESIKSLVSAHYTLQDLPIEIRQHDGESVTLRPVTSTTTINRQVLLLAGVLQHTTLYTRTFGDELLPLNLPAGEMLLIETQLVATEMFYSHDGGWLVMALVTIQEPRIELDLNEWLVDVTKTTGGSDNHLVDGSAVQAEFADASFCELSCFKDKKAEELVNLLERHRNEFTLEGPCNYRKYRCLSLAASEELDPLQEILTSGIFQRRIELLTGLDLAGIVRMRLCCLSSGDYQIINEDYPEPEGLDVIITLSPNNQCRRRQDGGTIFYVVGGEEVAAVKPRHNQMSLAYRIDDCQRFIAYLCHDNIEEKCESYYQIHLTYTVIG